jgi:large subunit ribosomal protein L24
MPKVKIRKGDEVRVMAGKDIGASGRVLEVDPRKGRVLVEGVNRVTRHERIRVTQRGAQEGGISHPERPIDVSNVALVCPTDGPTRAGYTYDDDGGKVRVCKKCGKEI